MNIDITARNRIKSTGTYIHLLIKELKAASKIHGFRSRNPKVMKLKFADFVTENRLRIFLNLPSNPLVMPNTPAFHTCYKR